MINSTVSPQMCCIKSIKGWFTHPKILGKNLKVNLSNAKKIRPDLFSKNLFWRLNQVLSSTAIEDVCYFLDVHIRLSTRCKMFHSKMT